MNISEKDLEKEFTIGRKKSAKPMLWVSMISMVMFFAGLTSAYVISMRRDDWVTFELPDAFYISTVLIILSSITISISQRLIKKEKRELSIAFLLITFALGIAFVWQQYAGFEDLRSAGLFFTGPTSTVSTSFIIGITLMHALHVFAGIIVLLVVIYNHFNHKYTSDDLLGFELGAIFWHFIDVLWIYLFFFFYFIR
ncbi:cytochrome c oxidase subunit 3 [Flavobacteriaceae bacterium]|jgi:cytochrome c oxidase subunit III|nr:cytochrome c oxidase subunit 3 [Flavobacteriaceae bacterium]MDB2336756.1 cytochrome c oxidase subunit 3 [Flavobacteriaceae bacterium]MDB2417912.1 cytochrome c oxidase subunit 3 [Flavobacteriaceae bacterium]MDB2625499.1 cytochrome c oxidase subunit 3 [Flavobacteriaceae bacterium]MDG2444050.1 cytochrome c oxidase subunit 3 [Flavobacteriaceae bacterium]|tara:strand:+ start:1615 stop:2205 length:591 start_codon:yes stop_codon:yes gene_type:complete